MMLLITYSELRHPISFKSKTFTIYENIFQLNRTNWFNSIIRGTTLDECQKFECQNIA